MTVNAVASPKSAEMSRRSEDGSPSMQVTKTDDRQRRSHREERRRMTVNAGKRDVLGAAKADADAGKQAYIERYNADLRFCV